MLLDSTSFPVIPSKKQRKRSNEIIDPLTGFIVQKQDFAEFYVMAHAVEGKDLDRASPFLIEKALSNSVGSGTITKRLRDGTLLIQVANESQGNKLLNIKSLGGIFDVTVREHATLNQCQGLIYCHDARFLTEEEILSGLNAQKQKVTAVRKIKRKINGELKDTALCILTFKMSYLPPYINFGFHRIPVQIYIPNPLRCLNCFKFGHPRKYCKKERVCAQCSELFHAESCSSGSKCVNCLESHNNWSRECEIFKKEFEIQKLRVTFRLSYFDAKKKFESMYPNITPTKQKNYSNALTGHNIQTDKSNSIPTNDKNSTGHLTGTAIKSASKQEQTQSIVNNKNNIEEKKQTEKDNSFEKEKLTEPNNIKNSINKNFNKIMGDKSIGSQTATLFKTSNNLDISTPCTSKEVKIPINVSLLDNVLSDSKLMDIEGLNHSNN